MAGYLTMRTYTTCMICITVFLLYADQNLLAPNLSAIADDFGFSDSEKDRLLGGYIAIGFFVVGGPMALAIGYFADWCNRVILFSVVVAFGESAGFATYWVKNYGQLFVCRVLTGISFGGATPIIFSMLGDLYPGKQRIYVSTFVGISLSAGIASGQLLAGLVGPWLGWRAPFLFIAVPALLCAAIIAYTVEEPKRGDQENAVRMLKSQPTSREPSVDKQSTIADPPRSQPPETVSPETESPMIQQLHSLPLVDPAPMLVPAVDQDAPREEEIEYSEKIEWQKVLRMFSTPSVAIIFIQGFPGCIPWGMINVFLNDYLSENRGMTVENATAVLTCFSIGGLVGQLFGGWCGQRLYNTDPRRQCALMGISTLLSVFPLLYLIDAGEVGTAGFFIVAILGGFIVNINGPNVRVVLQNVCIPEIRGTAFAVFTLSDDIGKGLGPALVVLLISACNGSRRKAFNIVVWFWLFCGTLLCSLVFTVVQDEARVNTHVAVSMLQSRRAQQDVEADPGTVFSPKSGILSPECYYHRIVDQPTSSSEEKR